MKINFDYYKGEDLYSDGDIEDEIINYIDKFPEEEYEKIFENDMRWPVFYHLTQIRQNILNWYDFSKGCDVLEIGAGMGAITGVLCKNAKSVTSVELSKRRATAISKRHKDKENLEIIVGNLNDIKFDKKFDYITLIGVFEYAALFTDSQNPFVDFLKNIAKLLKENGKILIAIENKFGLKYFAGAVEDHTSVKYDGILGYNNKIGPQTFGKEELISIFGQAGLNNVKFYYTLPDYKLPNVVFSDNYLPDEEMIEKYYDTYYYENTKLNFNEKKAYKEIIKNNKFDFFSNSFFIECSKEQIEENVEFALFNSLDKIQNINVIKCKNNKYYDEKIELNKKNKSEEIVNEYLERIEDTKNNNNEYIKFFKKDYINIEDEIYNLKEQIRVLEQNNLTLNDELEKVYHSRSWRYTNILRKLKKKK